MKCAAPYLQETPFAYFGGSADAEGLAYCVDGVQKMYAAYLGRSVDEVGLEGFATITGGAA
jgi:hypothetical protein